MRVKYFRSCRWYEKSPGIGAILRVKYSGADNVRHYAAAYCKCFGAELGDVFVKKLFLRLSPSGSSLKASAFPYLFPSLPVVMKLNMPWSI